MSSTPPPIPPRPVNIKMNGNRASMDTITRANFQQRLPSTTPPLLPPPPPALHNSDVLLLPQKSSIKNPPPLSSASSSESLNDSLGNIKLLLKIFLFYIFLALLSTASNDLLQIRSLSLQNGANNQTRPINSTAR